MPAKHSNHVDAKAYIILKDTLLSIHGRKIDERFIWREEYKAHLWDGKLLDTTVALGKTESEFDKAWREASAYYRNTQYEPVPKFVKCRWLNAEKAIATRLKL